MKHKVQRLHSAGPRASTNFAHYQPPLGAEAACKPTCAAAASAYGLHQLTLTMAISRYLLVALTAWTGACVGSMEEKYPNRIVADGSPFADADPFAPDADVPTCAPPTSPLGDGYHFPGEDCVACHRQAGGAPPFTIGGTLYTDADGSAPLSGAAIIIDDAAGNRFTLTTEANGNFYSIDAIKFPVLTYASLCPDVKPMLIDVPQTSASCNSASCHSPGFRVHL